MVALGSLVDSDLDPCLGSLVERCALWVGGESQSSGDGVEGKAEREGHREELMEPQSVPRGQTPNCMKWAGRRDSCRQAAQRVEGELKVNLERP